MKPIRYGYLLIIILIMGLCWWQVNRVSEGLEIRRFDQNGLPLRYVGPPIADGQSIPGVIIAHGFSGSQQLMLAYSYTLAHAGYGTLSLDFSGHGANPNPLNIDGDVLQENIDEAYEALIAQPGIDATRVAALGHSMGSGAVMRAGLVDSQRYEAILALSPTDAQVSPTAPPNLYFQAGQLEGQFVANAERLLAAAGGPQPISADGQGRAFDLIPNVEHITILFSPLSHAGARRWLNEVFGEQTAGRPNYVDRRISWYLLHLTAGLLLIAALEPLFRHNTPSNSILKRSWPWLWPLLAPIGGTLLLAGINLFLPVREFSGVLVGGAVALWFFITGLLWLSRVAFIRPALSDIGYGLILFALLSLAFGALGHLVWAPWWVIPTRLVRVPLFFLALLPIQMAAAFVQQNGRPGARWLWWLWQTITITVGLYLIVLLIPGMGFISLILPLLPLLLGIVTIGNSGMATRPWAAAIGNAAFFGWVLMVVFPII